MCGAAIGTNNVAAHTARGASGQAEGRAPQVALEPNPFAWIGAELRRNRRLRLPTGSAFPLLDRYWNPAVERSGAWHRFWVGRYGPVRRRNWTPLSWNTNSCGAPVLGASDTTSLLWSNTLMSHAQSAPDQATYDGLPLLDQWLIPPGDVRPPELLELEPRVDCPTWQKRRPVTFFRIDNERDTFHLLECDGSVSPEAIDRLSIMARPPGVVRPALPLSSEPEPGAPRGEWTPGIKLVHPRLVWAIQRIASAYPYRAVYVVSGYRPGSGHSFHARGRALDIQIVGVPNERTFALCRELEDVACGYYPNDRFVHVDVRSYCTGHPYWVDAAHPGEPARYVDGWPGVVVSGALLYGGEP